MRMSTRGQAGSPNELAPLQVPSLLPLREVRSAIVAARERYLEGFSLLFNRVHARFLEAIESDETTTAQLERLDLSMRGLSEGYARAQKMPVWPVEPSAVRRLVLSVLIPAMPIAFDLLKTWLFP